MTEFKPVEISKEHLPLDPVSYEELKGKKVNFDARPSGVNFTVDTNQNFSTTSAKMTPKADWHIKYDAFSPISDKSSQVSSGAKIKVSGARND
jgi:hypothetical protein